MRTTALVPKYTLTIESRYYNRHAVRSMEIGTFVLAKFSKQLDKRFETLLYSTRALDKVDVVLDSVYL